MDIKEYKKAIKDFFPLKGWKHKGGIQGGYFIQDTESVRKDINYGYTNLINEFNTGWAVGITIKSIEEILIKSLNIETNSGVATLRLLDFSPDYYNGTCSIEYVIKEESDIISMYKKLDVFFNVKASQFFEKFNTLDVIDKWFNDKPGEPVEYSSSSIRFNSQKGIIAAKLNNNPSYLELIKAYRDLLVDEDKRIKEKHPDALHVDIVGEFDQVVEYLKNI